MPLPRRRFLQGAGSSIALPALASLGLPGPVANAAAAAAARPKRMVFIAIGWGVTEETWYPDKTKTGSDWTLPEGLQPLARHKQRSPWCRTSTTSTPPTPTTRACSG